MKTLIEEMQSYRSLLREDIEGYGSYFSEDVQNILRFIKEYILKIVKKVVTLTMLMLKIFKKLLNYYLTENQKLPVMY